jgi:hypothetical protein
MDIALTFMHRPTPQNYFINLVCVSSLPGQVIWKDVSKPNQIWRHFWSSLGLQYPSTSTFILSSYEARVFFIFVVRHCITCRITYRQLRNVRSLSLCLSLSFSPPSLSLPRTLSLSLSLSLALSRTHTYTQSLLHTQSLTPTLMLLLSTILSNGA